MLCAVSFGMGAQPPEYVPTEGLVGWWPLDGNANEDFQSMNGTIYGATVGVGPNDELCLNFDGEDDYVEVPTNQVLESIVDELTISCWFLKSNSTNSQLVVKRDFVGNPNGERHHFELAQTTEVSHDRAFHFSSYDNSDLANHNCQVWTEDGAFDYDVWTHVSVTFANGLVKFFVDGFQMHEHDCGFQQLSPNNHWLNFARMHRSGGQLFSGELEGGMQNVGIWNRVLTDEEVFSLYLNNVETGCTDPSACNFNSTADVDDGSCVFFDECGICGGDGIPEQNCDCNGNQFDAIGVCGGTCNSDINNNGVCDNEEVLGCTYAFAENYNPAATDDDGSCTVAECNPQEEYGCNLEGDLNDDGFVDAADLLDFLVQFGAECISETSFVCGDPLQYQGYEYATVQIGEQCWFAENLRASSHQNGNGIPTGSTLADWNVAEGQGYQVAYGGLPAENCEDLSTTIDACDPSQSFDTYGLLYNNFVVIDPRGICPLGWHVGTDEDWGSLEVFLGMDEATVFTEGFRGTNQGAMIKTTTGWHNNGNGTDEVGFHGHPSGSIAPDQDRFANGGSDAVWWTPSGTNGLNRSRLMNDYNNGIHRATLSQIAGAAIRCVKD